MPLNPLIALQGQPVQVAPGESLIDRQLKLMQLDAARGQSGLRALQMQQLQRELQDQQLAQQYLQGGGAYVGGGQAMPRPGLPPSGAPSAPLAGPIREQGGYMSQNVEDNTAGQVSVPPGSQMPILAEGTTAPEGMPQPGMPSPAMPQQPQRRQLKPLSELAVDFYAKFPSIAPSMVKQFDEAIKTEQQAHKTLAETMKAQSEAQKISIEAKKQHLELMTSVLNGMSGNPDNFAQGIAALRELNVPDSLIQLVGPTYNASNIDKLRMMGADQKTLLEQQSKRIDQVIERQKVAIQAGNLDVSRQQVGINAGQLDVNRQQEQRLSTEMLPVDDGTQITMQPRFGAGAGSQGAAGALPSAKGAQVGIAMRTELGKKAIEAGEAAKGLTSTLDQIESLVNQGVYSNSVATKAALAAYRTTGTVLPGYDKDQLARTDQLLKEGTKLNLESLKGASLGQVTEAEHKLIGRAQGAVNELQSPEALKLALQELRTLTNGRITAANDAIKRAQSGEIGQYETSQSKLTTPSKAPAKGAARQPIALSPAEYQRGVAKAKQAGYSQAEYDAFLAQQGLQVPR